MNISELAPSFVCPRCSAKSWNSKDAQYGYCARCNSFTGEPKQVERKKEQ